MWTRRAGRTATTIGVAALLGCLALGAAHAHAVPAPPFPEYYGVSPATELSRGELDKIRGSGARTLRVPFYWPSIEPDPPPPEAGGPLPLPGPPAESKHFDAIDRLVTGAAENGIRVLPFVYGTPDWISSDPAEPPLRSAEARAAWQDLLGDLVRRYGPKGELWSENPDVPKTPIVDWQVGNEPNSELFWHPAPNPAEYAELVRLASEAIRSADPNASVVLAGMFGTPARGIEAWTFLDAFYQSSGIADAFDAYALHPYAPRLRGIEAQVELARDVLKRHGDRRLPLLVTEIGWPTDGPPDYEMVKSPRAQKAMLAKAFRLFGEERRRWKVERVVWYTWRDNDVQPGCSVCSHSGLFTADLEPKPAWRKFAEFAGGRP